MKDFKSLAENFKNKVSEYGFTYHTTSTGIVRVMKQFPKGNMDEFVKCDMDGPFLIALVPAKGGSVWGTDGGSVGGYSAVVNGNYCLNVSGVSKRFIKKLQK